MTAPLYAGDFPPRAESLWPDPVAVEAISRPEANRLLTGWDHPLGPCDRPFGQDHWLLMVGGQVCSLAVTASTVSPTVTDETGHVWRRKQLVELARIATHPLHRWSTRVMLRLWREHLARTEWRHWTPDAVVSYALPGKQGHIYRTDGWTKVRKGKKASPGKGSTWATGSAADEIGDGRKTLWMYRYGEAS